MSTAVQEKSILLELDFRPLKMSDKTFFDFCRRNKDYRFEMDKRGNLIVEPRSTLATSRKNSETNLQLCIWAEKDENGFVFGSNGMFTLPNGAKRAPDAFWILKERYFALSQEEREEQFARICPDFVIKLRSKSDNLRKLQNKMREYIENGARLGWLIDPKERRVYVYRSDKTSEVLENPKTVSGENVLPGFELDLTEIW
ncbi:MAG TPA: Uma2 family endonuclease [Pyrinomonadaceae bacterium]|nr:Uma2 family endonuclease [Pyrinomonadaceae bacterium]